MTASPNAVVHISTWIEENRQFFHPPVCNKLLYKKGQLKLFIVGGPNQRKDYHIEDGEELFFMLKGDMCLKVIENNVHKDVIIREGEIFLLPSNIYHSPQRSEGTIGLVVERERLRTEFDGLKYFTEKEGHPTLHTLYEKYFYCEDLGTQLAPIIKGYFNSEQYRTGIPKPEDLVSHPPVQYHPNTALPKPIQLRKWIEVNQKEIDEKGKKDMFEGNYQSQIQVLGPGEDELLETEAEIWLWVLRGHSKVNIDNEEWLMSKDESFLIPQGKRAIVKRLEDTFLLKYHQDPNKKMQE